MLWWRKARSGVNSLTERIHVLASTLLQMALAMKESERELMLQNVHKRNASGETPLHQVVIKVGFWVPYSTSCMVSRAVVWLPCCAAKLAVVVLPCALGSTTPRFETSAPVHLCVCVCARARVAHTRVVCFIYLHFIFTCIILSLLHRGTWNCCKCSLITTPQSTPKTTQGSFACAPTFLPWHSQPVQCICVRLGIDRPLSAQPTHWPVLELTDPSVHSQLTGLRCEY